jgi:polyhydroxybutyrate depolymerase
MLARELQSEYPIDSRRIYATGLSNGGMMSYRLVCEAGDLFAAIAPVSATQTLPDCPAT